LTFANFSIFLVKNIQKLIINYLKSDRCAVRCQKSDCWLS